MVNMRKLMPFLTDVRNGQIYQQHRSSFVSLRFEKLISATPFVLLCGDIA